MAAAQEPALTASRSQIAAALTEWDETAEHEGWTRGAKSDPLESADFLMMLLRKHGAG